MTDQRGLSFMDAVKELAAEAGMEVPAPDPRAAKKAEAQASLRDVTQAAAAWFAQPLDSLNGAPARDYLTKRGVPEAARRERKRQPTHSHHTWSTRMPSSALT